MLSFFFCPVICCFLDLICLVYEEFKRIWKESVVPWFDELSQQLRGIPQKLSGDAASRLTFQPKTSPKHSCGEWCAWPKLPRVTFKDTRIFNFGFFFLVDGNKRILRACNLLLHSLSTTTQKLASLRKHAEVKQYCEEEHSWCIFGCEMLHWHLTHASEPQQTQQSVQLYLLKQSLQLTGKGTENTGATLRYGTCWKH
jgi:hypothetical protein